MLNTSSSHYTNAGQLQENIYGKSDYTYSAQGVGYGYANLDALHGAAYGKQATDIVANVGSAGHVMAVRELEQRWRAVE
jgi:hypothetical protein